MIALMAASLDGIAFEEVGASSLLDRVDTKYALPAVMVEALLAEAAREYRVLTFGGRHLSKYRTDYFDTADFRFYRDHVIGREPRYKVRVRTYVDSAMTFLEVKWKNSRGRTVKIREPFHTGWDETVAALLNGQSGDLAARVPWSQLRPSLHVDYDRLTLVSRKRQERVTIDLALSYHHEGRAYAFPHLAVAEVKQERAMRDGLTAAIRARGLRESSLSKYILGVALLHPESVKTHSSRRLIERLNQMDVFEDGATLVH